MHGQNIEIISQAIIAITGIIAVFLSGSLNPRIRMYAGISGLLGEPFWFITSYLNNQWGIIILTFIYAIGWGRVFYKNYESSSGM